MALKETARHLILMKTPFDSFLPFCLFLEEVLPILMILLTSHFHGGATVSLPKPSERHGETVALSRQRSRVQLRGKKTVRVVAL